MFDKREQNAGYRSLLIYQQAHDLSLRIHAMSMNLPRHELYEEGSQIRRSSKSISANIVEGFALRKYKADYLRYLYQAYGSAEETLEHLTYLRETGSLADDKLYENIRELNLSVNRLLFRFIQGVQKQHSTPEFVCEEPAEYLLTSEHSLNPESLNPESKRLDQ